MVVDIIEWKGPIIPNLENLMGCSVNKALFGPKVSLGIYYAIRDILDSCTKYLWLEFQQYRFCILILDWLRPYLLIILSHRLTSWVACISHILGGWPSTSHISHHVHSAWVVIWLLGLTWSHVLCFEEYNVRIFLLLGQERMLVSQGWNIILWHSWRGSS